MTYKGKKGIYFGVWAPHAQAVHLVGDFNGWNPEANPMTKVGQSGIWEYFNAGMQVASFINSPLPPIQERSFTKLIHLPSAQNTVRVLLPLPQISADFPGMTVTGSQSVPRQI